MTPYRDITRKVESANEVVVKTKVVYCCRFPGCNFSTESDSTAQTHYGRFHATQGMINIGDVEFYLFANQQDFETFIEANRYHDGYQCQWTGPGWYGCHVDEDKDGSDFHLHNANFYRGRWLDEIDYTKRSIEKLHENIAEFDRHVKDLSAPTL